MRTETAARSSLCFTLLSGLAALPCTPLLPYQTGVCEDPVPSWACVGTTPYGPTHQRSSGCHRGDEDAPRAPASEMRVDAGSGAS